MSDPPKPTTDQGPTTPQPDDEDVTAEAIRTGLAQLAAAMVTLTLSFVIPERSADVILLLASMGLGLWAAWWGARERRWLIAVHGVAIALLDVLTLVSAPL